MGNRARYPSTSGGSIGRDYVEIKLKLNGASLPTVLAGASWLDASAPVSHTGGTNVIGLKMRDTWPAIVAHACDVRDDAGNGSYSSLGNIANESSTTQLPITFNVRTFNGAGTAQNDSTLTVVITLAINTSSCTYGN